MAEFHGLWIGVTGVTTKLLELTGILQVVDTSIFLQMDWLRFSHPFSCCLQKSNSRTTTPRSKKKSRRPKFFQSFCATGVYVCKNTGTSNNVLLGSKLAAKSASPHALETTSTPNLWQGKKNMGPSGRNCNRCHVQFKVLSIQVPYLSWPWRWKLTQISMDVCSLKCFFCFFWWKGGGLTWLAWLTCDLGGLLGFVSGISGWWQLKDFLMFIPKIGEMIPFDEQIFQMANNHQADCDLEVYVTKSRFRNILSFEAFWSEAITATIILKNQGPNHLKVREVSPLKCP